MDTNSKVTGAARFTAGPWQRKAQSIKAGSVHVALALMRPIPDEVAEHGIACDEDPCAPEHYSETDANAHLIAAAPALYEALDLAADWIALLRAGEVGEINESVLDAIRAALAQARGEA